MTARTLISVLSAFSLGLGACSSARSDDAAGGSAGDTPFGGTSGAATNGGGSDASSGGGGGVSGSLGGTSGTSSGASGAPGGAGSHSSGGGSGAAGTGVAGGTAGASAGGASTGGSGGMSGAPGGGGGAGTTGACRPDCGSHKWACWPMPNPASTALPNRASTTDLGEMVHDDVTCLDWQKTAPSGTYTWDQALAYCDGLTLSGHDDWRLPTRIELASIVDFTQSPAIDRASFPGAPGGFHKTASDWILTIRQAGAGAGRDYAWAFNVSDGIVSNAYSKATASALRCVRGGGTGEAPSAPAVAPPNQYTVIASGEVMDNYTGLVWQQAYSDATMTFAEAAPYCASLGLNGHAWRLPSIRELATLVDEAQVAPSINRTMFPNTRHGSRTDNWYWSGHAARGNASAAWAINFADGFTGFNAGASGAWNYWNAAWARCVR
jgi:hypothetical protein